MIKIDNLKEFAILVDFDGTITTEDTNVKLVEKYWNEKIAQYYTKESKEKLNYIQRVDGIYRELKVNEKEYLDLILNDINLTPGFLEFYNLVKKNNIPMAIVSGGFDNGIIPFLKKHGIEGIEVFANHLDFNGEYIKVDYYHNREANCCEVGYCGNCKTRHYDYFKKRYGNVIFIGDGHTDIPVAHKADIVFAKDGLLKYCKENNLNCIPWDDFYNINRMIFNK